MSLFFKFWPLILIAGVVALGTAYIAEREKRAAEAALKEIYMDKTDSIIQIKDEIVEDRKQVEEELRAQLKESKNKIDSLQVTLTEVNYSLTADLDTLEVAIPDSLRYVVTEIRKNIEERELMYQGIIAEKDAIIEQQELVISSLRTEVVALNSALESALQERTVGSGNESSWKRDLIFTLIGGAAGWVGSEVIGN